MLLAFMAPATRCKYPLSVFALKVLVKLCFGAAFVLVKLCIGAAFRWAHMGILASAAVSDCSASFVSRWKRAFAPQTATKPTAKLLEILMRCKPLRSKH